MASASAAAEANKALFLEKVLKEHDEHEEDDDHEEEDDHEHDDCEHGDLGHDDHQRAQ